LGRDVVNGNDQPVGRLLELSFLEMVVDQGPEEIAPGPKYRLQMRYNIFLEIENVIELWGGYFDNHKLETVFKMSKSGTFII
jgi:hypothetical protein